MINVNRYNVYTIEKGWSYDFVIQPAHEEGLIKQAEKGTIEEAIKVTLDEMEIPVEEILFDETFEATSMDEDMSNEVVALVYFPAGEGPPEDAEFVDPRTLL